MKLRLNISAVLAALATCTWAEGVSSEGTGLHRRDFVYGSPQLAVAGDVSAAGQAVQAQLMQQIPSSPQAVAQLQGIPGIQRFADTTQILVQAPSPAVAAAASAMLQPMLHQVPVAAAAATPLAAPALVQPAAPVAGATVVDPATAAAYAQQQFYPAAVGIQPLVQQLVAPAVGRDGAVGLPGGLVAGTLPTAVIFSNPMAPQAIVPVDPAVTDLLAPQAAAVSSTAASARAAASTLSPESADDESASAEESAGPEEEASVAPHRSSKSVGKASKPHGSASRKTKSTAASKLDDDAEPLADSNADALDSDGAADSVDVGVRRKSRAASRSSTSGTKSARGNRRGALREDNAEADVDAEEEVVVSTRRYKAGADDGDALGDSSNNAADARSGYRHVGGSHVRNSHGNLREEAAQAREEASLAAREAVLSEIRAEASAEAALRASSELHLEENTIVRDEEASLSRLRETYEPVRVYSHVEPLADYSDDRMRTRAADEGSQATTTIGRYADGYGENTSTWDVHHAVSWANSRSHDDDGAQLSYHPYSHGASSYGDSDHDNTGGYWRARYGDGSTTGYPGAGAETTASINDYSHTYSDDSHSHTYSDDSHSHTYYDDTHSHAHYDDSHSSYADRSNGDERANESQNTPYNLVNRHADSIFASDAAAALSSPSATADAPAAPTGSLRAVNDLDPLSYATQGCSFRSNLPLSAPYPGQLSEQPSIVIIGLPSQATQAAVVRSVAPSAATVMVTKLITPAVKVVYASDSDD